MLAHSFILSPQKSEEGDLCEFEANLLYLMSSKIGPAP